MWENSNSKVIFIMGVSGCGKTSVGQLLADDLAVPFIEGDDHHSRSSIDKMSKGIPLNDEDRKPWLEKLNKIAVNHVNSGCVIACSALKKSYRKQLVQTIESNVQWIYLHGSYDQIFERMNSRQDHFMGSDMLKSQFEILEEPENAIKLDIVDSPEVIVQKIKSQIE